MSADDDRPGPHPARQHGDPAPQTDSVSSASSATPPDTTPPTPDDGDAACWLGLLCPECGAVPEREGAQDPRVPCWRCGAVRAQGPEGPRA